jgi:hypothetical protein
MTTILGFLVALFIAFVGLCAVFFVWANLSGKNDENRLAIFKSNNNIKKYQLIRFNREYLIYDYEKDGLWIYNPKKDFGFIYKNSIFGCELKIDDNTEYRTSISSAAGRAVVGGLLLGGVGAIIGGVTGRKDARNLVHKVTLVLYFDSNNGYNGYKEIEVFSDVTGCKMDNSYFRNDYNRAMSWCKFIEQQKKIAKPINPEYKPEYISEKHNVLINSILNNDTEGVIRSIDHQSGLGRKSQSGETALELAIQKNNKYIVAYLIKYGAYPVEKEMEVALKYGNKEIIEMVKTGNHQKLVREYELLRKTI